MRGDRDQVLGSLDEGACLEFLARMVRHKSYTETPGERRLAEFMVRSMDEIGLKAALQPVVGERRNAIGTWRGVGGGPSLLFNGHLDTNPATDGWTLDPWGGLVDEAFIYGIGVSNMKAGDAAFFCAVRTLKDAGVRVAGDVVLTFVVGELQGGIGTVRAIEQGVRADYFINAEPTDLAALTMHAGAFNFEIELVGQTRHLSKREEAVDAVAATAALVPRLNAMSFSGAANAAHSAVDRAHVGIVHAALGPELHDWRPPQVGDHAILKGAARYAPSQSVDSVLADMEAVLEALRAEFPGLSTSLTRQNTSGRPHMLPFEVDRGARIVKVLNGAYAHVRGAPQPTGSMPPPCFYGTDAAHFQHRLGMEGVVCGPGGRYNTMPDERVDRADYLDMIRIYMLAIMDICAAP